MISFWHGSAAAPKSAIIFGSTKQDSISEPAVMMLLVMNDSE